MLLWKLLKKNISIPQLLGYGFAALLGMCIVLLAVCFYADTRPLFSSDEGLFKTDFIVLTKKVSLRSTINSDKTTFSDKEIEELRKQPFVKDVSFFTPARFNVQAYMSGFSTEMFFEAVPDHLIESKPADWAWSEGQRLIPVIVPRSYLNLYNFGFAQSRGMPQVSENMIGQITASIIINGQGKQEVFNGRIVGFTNRINTILVPEAFINWANERFAGGEKPRVSRVIAELKNPADPAVAEYIAAKNYDVNDDKGEQGKMSYFLKMLVIIVSAVGVLIMALAVALMLLSINLLIYKNQKTFENLMLLGYSRFQLAKPYYLLTASINIGILIISMGVIILLRNIYLSKLSVLKLTAQSSQILIVAGMGLLFALLVTVLNCIWIHYKTNSIQIPKRR